MRTTKLFAVFAFVGAASAVSSANAQGTDCRYPVSPPLTIAEVTVCRNPALSQLEERLTRRYLRIRSELRGRDLYEFEREQEVWRASRRNCGYDTGCLYRLYERRLGEMREVRDDQRDYRDPRNYGRDPRDYYRR
jgi:uncharacterized protein